MAATAGGKGKEEPLHLKQGGKLFSRMLTRDSSVAAPSFRVYYGVASAGSVPFLWESQPGTPKNEAVSTAAMPPLTPPPSYYVAGAARKAAATTAAGGNGKKFKPTGILGSILSRIVTARKARPPSTSPSSCSSSSSSSSSSSLSASSSSSLSSFLSTQSPACSSMRGGGGSNRLHASSVSDEEEAVAATCFRVRHESFRALKGCRVAMTVRSALPSVGGGGHGLGPSTAAAQRV